MYKLFSYLTPLLILTVFTGCGSDSQDRQIVTDDSAVDSSAEVVTDKSLYLRGEMNDYGVSQTYKLSHHGGALCTFAMLRSDWSPYKFKFADANWSKGSNFGFATPPGVMRQGSSPVKLNPNSRFEELSYEVKYDGVYRFCLIKRSDGYYADVQETDEQQLPSLKEQVKAQE
ncbi:MAG: hypothetical protein K6F05_01275 [Succinivibrio sp.]|nr:hypothetical protein [Succinivibrio sp.]